MTDLEEPVIVRPFGDFYEKVDAWLRSSTREMDLETLQRIWEGDATPVADWYCLQVEPWQCRGCGARFSHHTWPGVRGEHYVVVWPSRDDPNMYSVIGALDGKAAIVPYEDALGPAKSYYEIHPS